MPQSLCELHAHLVFSTKDRRPLIRVADEARIHAYLATLCRDLGSDFVVVGGVEDHVHILLRLPKLHAPATVVERVKKESSKFVKTLGPGYREFFWQRGYAMFSVGRPERDAVEAYVRGQREHHRKTGFEEEVRGLFERYGIAYDERYVWD